MTTHMLIVFFIIVICICYFKISNHDDYHKRFPFIMILTILSLLMTAILLFILTDNKELRQQLKTKCPEYEMIDNVYKLKK